MHRRWIILIIFLSMLGITALGVIGFSNAQNQITPAVETPATVAVEIGDVVQSVGAPGLLVGTKEVLLGMSVSGPLEKIFVEPGDMVEKGQLLARLGNEQALNLEMLLAKEACLTAERELQEIYDRAPLETAQAQMDLTKAQEELNQALYRNLIQQEGNRASSATLTAAEAKLALAEDEIKHAEQEFIKLSGRPVDDPIRANAQLLLSQAKQRRDSALLSLNWYKGHPTELQQSMLDAEIAIAEARLLLAEIGWERVQNGPDPEILAEAELKLARAKGQLAKTEADLEGVELYAPFDGVILEVNAKPGEQVVAGIGFILLGDLNELEVAATVIEEDFPQIEMGQTVDLFFDARSDAETQGKVERIIPKRLPGDRPLYEVHISIDELPEGLVSGMTADASIVIAIQNNVLRLPKSLVRSHSDGTAKLEMWVNGHIEERLVQVGLRGDSYIEILSGLQAGDLIVSEFGS